ncbi:hypothetical protein ABT124_15720 [Streptomyces sp. NPDC001982]|uniref:hypothetical protein n=1 Tax=Streptomyces sp. NPDC001982 TaxID=3154405 RepID=UPI003323EF70
MVLPVEALPSDHAVDLFIRLSGRVADSLDRDVLDDLVRLCGYLPLGVSLLAARLRHHPSWSAEDLHERLVAARDRLGELRAGERAVAATFDLSYRDLAPERQHFFQCLGFYPGTELDAYVGAALGSVSVTVARQQLDVLYDAHLRLRAEEHGTRTPEPTVGMEEVLAVAQHLFRAIAGRDGERTWLSEEILAVVSPATPQEVRRGYPERLERFADQGWVQLKQLYQDCWPGSASPRMAGTNWWPDR